MTGEKTWEELRAEFSHVAFRRGIENVASAIPADRVTVYRILNGTTQRPSRAIREGIERVVEQDEEQTDG